MFQRHASLNARIETTTEIVFAMARITVEKIRRALKIALLAIIMETVSLTKVIFVPLNIREAHLNVGTDLLELTAETGILLKISISRLMNRIDDFDTGIPSLLNIFDFESRGCSP